MNTESSPENVIGIGCLTVSEMAAIAIGAIAGGPVGAVIGAAIPPTIAYAYRAHEETKNAMIKEMPSRQKLEGFLRGMHGESTGVYFDTRDGKFKDK